MDLKKRYILLLVSALFLYASPFIAQDKETEEGEEVLYEPSLALHYFKNTDGARILTGEIKVKRGRQFLPLENAEIKFFAGVDAQINLGTAKSNKQGKAILELSKETELPFDDSGAVVLSAKYEAEENSQETSDEKTIIDIAFEMTLEEVDSIKTIRLTATKMGKNKEMFPLGDFEIDVFVKRLYSDLKIGSIYLDAETGSGEMEMPTIPGDSIGNIVVIARVTENDEYGTVEQSAEVKWGTPVEYRTSRLGPALWSSNAPLWMTITLYIFIAGVFYHLILIINRLFKIKKLGLEARKDPNFK
jgi:hypothetical protein